MDLSTITIPQAEAEEHWREYAEAVKRGHEEEDAALAAGYKALAAGKRLISLPTVMAEAGCDADQLPRLAIAKARATWCWVERWANGACRFRSVEESWRVVRSNSVSLPPGTFPRCEWNDIRHGRYGLRSMVPIVPPRHRPKRSPRMTGYHVLWEVDRWEEAPAPPGDPALLKHLRGDLWLLLATWDLTELERAVLTERAL